MQFVNKELTCVVGPSRYTVEYWTQMNLNMEMASSGTPETIAEPLLMSWIQAPTKDGFEIKEKGQVKSYPGFVGTESRAVRGGEKRIDRHFLHMPRHIFMKTVGPESDLSNHERFHASLKIGAPGAKVGEAPEGTIARTMDFAGGKISVALPCVPIMKEEAIDTTPEDGKSRIREFECRHPTSNFGFSGQLMYFERPIASPQGRKTKSTALVQELSTGICKMLQSGGMGIPPSKCRASAPKSYGVNGSESTLDGDSVQMRLVADYPYVAMITIIASSTDMTAAEKQKVLSSLKVPGAP